MDKKIMDAVLNTAEEVLGLPPEEMTDNMDLDLFENGLIDSVGCAAFIAALGDALNKKLSIDRYETEDFTSLASVCAATERILKK